MRIYLDSQIFRFIKPSSPSFNSKLKTSVDLIASQVVIPFSDAHLDDLSSNKAKPELTTEDLLLMEHICKDDYFSFDVLSRKFLINKEVPTKAYANKMYDVVDDVLSQPEQFNSFFDNFSDDPCIAAFSAIFKTFIQSPFPAISG